MKYYILFRKLKVKEKHVRFILDFCVLIKYVLTMITKQNKKR